ncbi:unnamed protein product [Mesocestoides corti]|uniref:Uncharacterized protein n=1 Tax=Mesocestoides corti TaxID=53468 RepID=A0A0R3U3A1_MESCO|nr:unnamed protein product [Mesocestoides corti]
MLCELNRANVRHSLRNPSHLRADSPTPDDLFPVDVSAVSPHSTGGLLPAKLATTVETKPTSFRPTGISVTSTVPPLVLQRRTETDGKHCKWPPPSGT